MRKSFFLIPPLLLGTACVSVPKMGVSPALQAVSADSLGQGVLAGRTDTASPSLTHQWPTDQWWTAYADSQLDALIAEAFTRSPDTQSAVARLEASRAAAIQAGAELLPGLAANAQGGGNQQSKNLGIPPDFVPPGVQETARATANLSFDLDLWGRNRALLAAATSDMKAAEVDVAQARLLLARQIVKSYAQLQTEYALEDVAREALSVRQKSVDLTSRRVIQGLDTRGELRQAESLLPQARADLLAAQARVASLRYQLAALVGAPPARADAITRPAMQLQGHALPDDAALNLLGRRPDIVAARLRVEAQQKRIKAAKASFLPNINLSAMIGLQSLGFENFFEKDSLIADFGPAIYLPIFDGGRLRANYRNARSGYDLSVAEYNRTLLEALRQVADTVTGLNSASRQLTELQQSYGAAQESNKIAGLRYQGGLSNQLSVLVSDDNLLAVRRRLVETQANRILLEAELAYVLGGGFVTDPTRKITTTSHAGAN